MSYWLALILMPAVLIGWATMLAKKTAPTGVSISFVGYTNSIMGSRFALFSLVNDDRLAIRWRGVASEVEGLGGMRAPVFDPTLPWITTATLKPGGSIRLAVGEPLESGRWRVQLRFSRCTVSERLSDFSTRHKLPAALVAFLPEVPRVYSTNSEWLKATSLWK